MGWDGSRASNCVPIFVEQAHVRYRLLGLFTPGFLCNTQRNKILSLVV